MKPFWKSKTIWANAVSVGLYVAKHFGVNVPAPAPELIAVVNLVLRFLTKQPIGV